MTGRSRYADRISLERALLDDVLSCPAIGSPAIVQATFRSFIDRTGADELMTASQICDHAARLRSYEITACVLADKDLNA